MISDIRQLLVHGLTDPLKEVLRKQAIELGDPGPILLDIQTLIDAIGEGVVTTSKYFVLPQGRLDECNEQLREPLIHRLKRPQLRSFPTLMGLFMLLRSIGLAVGETVPRRAVRIDPEMLVQWNSLNATEKYMSLLECWVTTASTEALGGGRSMWAGMVFEIRTVYFHLEKQETTLTKDHFYITYGTQNLMTLSLLHQFGWVRLEYDSIADDGKTAQLRSIRRLPLGDAMIAALCEIDRFDGEDSTSLRETFEGFFPDWKRSLSISEPGFREGEHMLKVSVGEVWRRIAAPAETSLDDFAHEVLDAFDFDHDHLYEFRYRNHQGIRVQAVAPPISDAKVWADEVRLGELPISEGDTITMLYDFGDDWEFHIKLEQISDEPSRRTGPEVVKRSGTAPKQYMDDDWD